MQDMGRMSSQLDCSRYGLLAYAMSLTPSATKERGLLTTLLVPSIVLISAVALAQEPVQTADAPKDYVSEVLPWPIDTVHDRAMLLFDSDARDYYDDYNPRIYDLPEPVADFRMLSQEAHDKFMALPLVRPGKFYVFYGAYANMQGVIGAITPLAAMGHSNAALQRYAARPQSERTRDIYLWSPDVPFWHSEYSLSGKPLPFKSYFIVHLSPVDEAHTEVEIIENEPVVRLKQHSVEPTTSDREFLLSCIHQFIERGVPGRHWFSCKTAEELALPPPVPFTVP
jgi:hypothetical protein